MDDRFQPWTIEATDGRVIPAYQSAPAGVPSQTVLLAIHGLGDHGRAIPYQLLAEAATCRGHRVISFDHRGHGPAAQRLGSAASWTELRQDLVSVAKVVRAKYPAARLVAVGASMGGILALDVALSEPLLFDRVIAASAPLGPVRAPRTVLAMARLLGRWAPGVRLRTGFDHRAISRDDELLTEYVSDRFFHDRVTARLAIEILAVVERTRSHADGLGTHTLLLHGLADRIAQWDDTFLRNAPARICEHKLYEGSFHNLFIDTN